LGDTAPLLSTAEVSLNPLTWKFSMSLAIPTGIYTYFSHGRFPLQAVRYRLP
jgi:hypothetical protein